MTTKTTTKLTVKLSGTHPNQNLVTIIGNLGKDPEFFPEMGTSGLATFSLCHNHYVPGRTEGQPNWFKVVCWGELGQAVAEELAKGQRVEVRGRLQARNWTDTKGGKRTEVEIVAEDVALVVKPANGTTDKRATPAAAGAKTRQPANPADYQPESVEDEETEDGEVFQPEQGQGRSNGESSDRSEERGRGNGTSSGNESERGSKGQGNSSSRQPQPQTTGNGNGGNRDGDDDDYIEEEHNGTIVTRRPAQTNNSVAAQNAKQPNQTSASNSGAGAGKGIRQIGEARAAKQPSAQSKDLVGAGRQ